LGLAAVGIYFTVFSLSGLIFEVPTGYIADRFGRKFSVLIGIAFKIVGIIILVMGTSLNSLIANAFIYGAGNALISGALDALLYQSVTHQEYEETTSHSVPFYQIGLVLSAILGGYFFELNIHLPVIAEAVLLCVLVVPVMMMAKDARDGSGELSPREALRSLKMIITNRISLIFLAVYLVYTTVIALFLEILLERKMIELTITPSQRGIVIAGVKIIAILIVQTLVARKIKSIRAKALVAFASGIASFAIISIAQSVPLFIIFYLLTNPFTMWMDVVLSPIMQKLSRHKTRATDISMYALLSRVAFATTAPVAGWYLAGGHSTMGVLIACVVALIFTIPSLFKTLRWYEAS
jgi:MFS family permease